jgi:hypothetical protein
MFSSSPYTPTPAFQANYVSTHKRAQIVRILLTVGLVLSVFSLVFSLVQYAFPELTSFEDETPGPATIVIALLIMGLALLEIVVYIATIVFFLMWLYRSYENLPAFGIRRGDIEYSSGWAVGSFFVPIVLLVVPYRAVRELWRKSVPNQSNMFRDLGPPAFFPLWWGAWLLSGFVSQIYLRTMFQTDLTPEVELTLGILTSVLSILAAVFAIMVVNEIDRQQIESSKLVPHQFISQTPPPPEVVWNEAAQPQTGL